MKKTTKKAYVLYHGEDNGNHEDCNIFYAEPEVFLDKKKAKKRVKELNKAILDTSAGYTYLITCILAG